MFRDMLHIKLVPLELTQLYFNVTQYNTLTYIMSITPQKNLHKILPSLDNSLSGIVDKFILGIDSQCKGSG